MIPDQPVPWGLPDRQDQRALPVRLVRRGQPVWWDCKDLLERSDLSGHKGRRAIPVLPARWERQVQPALRALLDP